MQEPASSGVGGTHTWSTPAITEYPQPDTGGVAGDVVVALDVATVPPSTLDALGALLELERAVEARSLATLERLRLGQQPQRLSPIAVWHAFRLQVSIRLR